MLWHVGELVACAHAVLLGVVGGERAAEVCVAPVTEPVLAAARVDGLTDGKLMQRVREAAAWHEAMGRAAGADDRLVARGGLVATASCPGERTLSRIKVSASTSETPLASAMAERRSRSVERMRTTTVEGCLGGAIG